MDNRMEGPQKIKNKITMKVKALGLCNPMDCSPPGPSIHGVFQARILEWVAIFFSRVSTRPMDWTQVSHIAGRLFTLWATRESHNSSVLGFGLFGQEAYGILAATPPLGIYEKELRARSLIYKYIHFCSSIIHNSQKQSKCSSTHEPINKVWHMDRMEYCPAF